MQGEAKMALERPDRQDWRVCEPTAPMIDLLPERSNQFSPLGLRDKDLSGTLALTARAVRLMGARALFVDRIH